MSATPFPALVGVLLALAGATPGSLRATAAPPVSPNVQPQATALLQFLDNISGRYLLAGQQEIAWSQARKDEDFNYIIAQTGKTPAVRGFDFLEYVYSPSVRANQDATERAIAWSKAGGIVNFCCHMFMNIGSPAGNPQFYVPSANNGVGTTFDIRQAVIAGTPENIEFLAKLDIIAAELTKLRDAGVPVVWRPFHECSGNWFWWGVHGADPLKQAWRIMYDRFTNLNHLNNLIWCFNPTDSFTTMQTWYPGDDVVDMISLDVYPGAGSHPTYAADYQRMRNFTSGQKVVTMSEDGAIPDPDQLFADGAGWAYFCTWNGFENDLTRNSVAFLNTVYNHAKVITLDKLPALYAAETVAIVTQPQPPLVAAGSPLSVSVAAQGPGTLTYQWLKDGTALAGATSPAFTLAALQPADAGLYRATVASAGTVTSDPAIVGVSTTSKVIGAGAVVGANIPHPNGNIYDQVLLSGAAAVVTAEGKKVTRTSFIDLTNDIVQVEFGGAGTLSLVLDNPSGPAAPVNYNQPTVSYMKGHAGIVITGADDTTNVGVFSVGRFTAFDPTGKFNSALPTSTTNNPANNGSSLFVGQASTTYDGLADLAFIAISSTNGKFGGVRTANASYYATKGFTGLYAPGVQFTGPVYIGDINASGTATPVLVIGSSPDTRITGGGLLQADGRAVQVSGLTQLKFTDGQNSHGRLLPAQTNKGLLLQNYVDVTAQIVVNQSP